MSSLICDASTGKSLQENEKEKEINELKALKKHMEEDEDDPVRRKHTEPIAFPRIRIKISDSEINAKRELYDSVVVQDFGDIYHMTDEERKADNEMYELFMSIQQVKTKYRKLDQLVIAYRKILKVVKAIAESNSLIVDTDKFVNDVLTNKIILYGVRFPKYSAPKKKRKEVNWELVSQYIMDESLDPRDLVKKSSDYCEWDEQIIDPKQSMIDEFGMTYEEFMKDVPLEEHGDIDLDEPEKYIGENVIARENHLKDIKLRRTNKELFANLRDIAQNFKKASQFDSETRKYESYIWNSTYSDIDEIRAMDEERGLLKKRKSEPEFNGNFLDDDAVNRFLYQADEYIKDHDKVKDQYSGKYITRREYEESELSSYLEECGWNIRKLYNIEDDLRKIKKKVKSDEKRNKKIRKSILDADSRKKKRVVRRGFTVSVESDEGINSKKKKISKKKKKAKKKMDKILPRSADDFDSYENMMKDIYGV